MCRESFLNSKAIWFANSLVGAKIKDWILKFFIFNLLIIGIQKATVFPEPVFAWAIKSLLSRLKGKLFCCIDVSFVYDKESRFAKNSFDKFNCEKFSIKMGKPL